MGAIHSYFIERDAQQEATRIINKPRRRDNVSEKHMIGVWKDDTEYPDAVVRILASKGVYCEWELREIVSRSRYLIQLTCAPESDATK